MKSRIIVFKKNNVYCGHIKLYSSFHGSDALMMNFIAKGRESVDAEEIYNCLNILLNDIGYSVVNDEKYYINRYHCRQSKRGVKK